MSDAARREKARGFVREHGIRCLSCCRTSDGSAINECPYCIQAIEALLTASVADAVAQERGHALNACYAVAEECKSEKYRHVAMCCASRIAPETTFVPGATTPTPSPSGEQPGVSVGELVGAVIKIRSHTAFYPGADRDLLVGLLGSIERIADDILARARQPRADYDAGETQ